MSETSEPAVKREATERPPTEDLTLIRAIYPGYELRDVDDGKPPTMVGHFARFNQWAEIDSVWEGHFMERFVPGAFKKTFSEGRDRIRALFQHGHDPQVGDKPLGPVDELLEDDEGAYYEVPLLDAPYVRDDILPGLKAGLYGASFRFRMMKEEYEDKPRRSEHNPDGLPERTITEAKVMEFGPVTFPAYQGASAGVRSLTDEFVFGRMVRDPARFAELVKAVIEPQHSQQEEPEPSEAATPEPASRSTRPSRDYLRERKETPPWRL